MIRNAVSSFVRTVAGKPATARTSRLSRALKRRPLRVTGGASSASGCAMGSSGYGLNTAFAPAELTISHLPLIFCTWWLTATTLTTLAEWMSM